METGQYIEHRLEIAGARKKIFMPDAIHEIHRISHGYPRAINILCDHALLTGYAAGKQTVDGNIVKECENELNIDAEDDFDFSHSMSQSSAAQMRPQPLPKSVPESGAASEAISKAASVKPKPPPLNFDIRPKPKPKPAPIPAMLSQKPKVWYYPVVIAVAITMVAVAGYYFLGFSPDNSGSMQDATGPINFKLSDPSAKQGTPPPASPESGNALAQSNSGVETNITVRPEAQPAVEPPPDASETTSAETATPEPRPETPERTTVADEPASIKPEASSTDEHASAETPAEESEIDEEKQPVPDVAAVSPQAVSGPAVTEQSETTQSSTGSPASESAGQSDKPSSSFPPMQPPAEPEGASSVSPTKDIAVTPPPPAPATPPATKPRVADPSQAIVGTPSVSTPAQNIENPASAATDPSAQKDAATTPAEPALPATAALQPQDTQTQPVAEKPTVDDALRSRLKAFIQEYCNTYSAKDLNGFADFFTADATENGKSFAALLPKYRKNFTFIDTIYYRIEIQQIEYEADGKTLKADGTFFLRWLPPDKKWRENAGKITMRIQESDDSFQVHRLNYQSNRP